MIHFLSQHFHLKSSRKEQSLWSFFLAFCLSATIGLALGFEYIGGYLPCNLCLIERFPYYSAIPILILAGFSALFSRISFLLPVLFWCVFILMTISFILAVYHMGVEYGFWPIPPGCSVTAVKNIKDVSQLLNQVNSIYAPSCIEAPWRFLFLSFAGWNAIASLFFMLISFYIASKGLLSGHKKS
ncbi:disulfide bond formation protein B [Bartonella sp. CB169]|uniref:disulfide bond formation protein B n=1 Tax=Bartonella sp. CB169 TaxID=3112257 RepID=UPI00300E4144